MKKVILILLALLAVHLFLLVNIEFTAWPEILSFPYLKNNGFFLYKDMVHAYPPFLTLLLAYYFKVVGYGLAQLKIFTWSGILVNDVLIFLLVRLLTKDVKKALWATLFYVVVQPLLEGNMLWFDNALTTPILFSLYFLLLAYQDKFRKTVYVFLAGLFLGISLVTKQTALAYALVSGLFLLWNRLRLKKLLVFGLGPIVLVGLLILRLIQEGALAGFWNWTFYLPATFWTDYPTYLDLSPGRRELAIVLLLLLPAATFLLKEKRKIKKEFVLLLLFLAAGVMAVYPRFSFYHFQPALAVAVVTLGASSFSKRFSLTPLVIALSVIVLSLPWGVRAWGRGDRFFAAGDLTLTRTIKEKNISGSIYLLGLHSGLYVVAEKLPPKPWVDNFGWYFEIPGISEWFLEGWAKNPPEAIFWKAPEKGEWYELGTYQPKKVAEFIRANYTKEEDVSLDVSFWRRKK